MLIVYLGSLFTQQGTVRIQETRGELQGSLTSGQYYKDTKVVVTTSYMDMQTLMDAINSDLLSSA